MHHFKYSIIFLLWAFTSTAQDHNVRISGAMKHVMKEGKLQGTIALDTIANKTNLYGIGPLENLAGEIMVYDGRSYISRIVDGKMKMDESFDAKAPFFVSANVSRWKKSKLPDSIRNVAQLNDYIDSVANGQEPFAFKLTGKVETASIHVVNLPAGTKVSSPAEAHAGMVNFDLPAQDVEIIGFFSRKHQAIFTHHDTFIHLHLLTADRKSMGHLDEIVPMEMTLHLPE